MLPTQLPTTPFPNALVQWASGESSQRVLLLINLTHLPEGLSHEFSHPVCLWGKEMSVNDIQEPVLYAYLKVAKTSDLSAGLKAPTAPLCERAEPSARVKGLFQYVPCSCSGISSVVAQRTEIY